MITKLFLGLIVVVLILLSVSLVIQWNDDGPPAGYFSDLTLRSGATLTVPSDATLSVNGQDAGDVLGRVQVQIAFVDTSTSLSTGDAPMEFTVTEYMNGMNLVKVDTHVTTASSTGTITWTVVNVTDSNQNMMTTDPIIDTNETTSYTGTRGVPNTLYDDVVTGDLIKFTKSGAVDAYGDGITLVFALP